MPPAAVVAQRSDGRQPSLQSSPALWHSALGPSIAGTLQTVVREGDLPLLLRLVEGARGRGALRSVTVCCANQRLQRDTESPPWATAAVRKPALGAPCPSPWAGAGSVLRESPFPTGPGPVLGSSVKLTEEASQTQEKEEGKTELFCDP